MSSPLLAADATTAQHRVFVGSWTNWSRGPIFGATLTLNRQDGNLLIAFTAFFIGFVSTRFWRIACLMVHRYYSTPEARDALHHQRQAILRNSSNAEGGLWTTAQLFWAWRCSTRRPLWRMLPIVSLATLCACAFAIASGFSSRISIGITNEVLLDGSNCAIIYLGGTGTVNNLDANAIVTGYRTQLVSNAANYAQQCYSSNNSGVFDCTSFVTGRLPGTVDENALCPFKNAICRNSSNNIFLDTGYLDSLDHLGLNSPPSERILFRSTFHCAPLVTEGHKTDFNGTDGKYTRYDYGPVLRGPADNRTSLNYTFEVETRDAQYGHKDNFQRNYGASFRLFPMVSQVFNGTSQPSSDFIASEDLFRSDGDSQLFFVVGNGVSFLQPTEDEWYRARVPGSSVSSSAIDGSATDFEPEEAASPMGCVQQFQFCNAGRPAGDQCGPLGGLADAMAGAGAVFNLTVDEVFTNETASDKSASRFLWFTRPLLLAAATPYDITASLGAQSLLSQQNQVFGFQSARLPSNQWQLEVTHWWSTWLASLQAAYVAVASGPSDPVLQQFRQLPGDSSQQEFCSNQKFQTTEYTSFSIFGLCFIFVTGTLIVAMSYILAPIYNYLHRRYRYKSYKHLEWATNDTLHLQQLAYQGFREGTWSNGTGDIPITKPGEILRPLTLSRFVSETEMISENQPAAKEKVSPDHQESQRDEKQKI